MSPALRLARPGAFVLVALLALSAYACSSSTSPSGSPSTPDAAPADEDASSGDAAAVDAADASTPTGACASAFGQALTEGFGRIDGTVWAVQKPSDTQCALPNRDHVIVQVLVDGAVYRLVTNVQSDRGDPSIRFGTLSHALPAPAFAEGWHLGLSLDYATTLGAHSATGFAPLALDAAVAKIADAVEVGAPVSIYATVGDKHDSAHLIHRNTAAHPGEDGAIVVDPAGATPTFLLFHFDEQTF